MNEDEMRRAEDRYTHFVVGTDESGPDSWEYRSDNAHRLDVQGVRGVLRRTGAIQ